MVSRMTRFRTMLLALLALVTLSLSAAPVALAQGEPIRPPRVEEPAKPQTWLFYIVGGAAIVLCVGLAVFPSRRTHED